jgi:hypothetical protein
MGRNRKDLSTPSRVAGKLSFGALVRSVPRTLVDEELEKAGRMHKRVRALPAHVVLYYMMAMCGIAK